MIYRSKATTIKFSVSFSQKQRKVILKVLWNYKRHLVTKATWGTKEKKKDKARSIAVQFQNILYSNYNLKTAQY
jgi:hypothetical protein